MGRSKTSSKRSGSQNPTDPPADALDEQAGPPDPSEGKPWKIPLEWRLEPELEVRGVSTFHMWNSYCGWFRLYRIDTPSEGVLYAGSVRNGTRWDMIESSSLGGGYPRYFKNMEDALSSVEKYVGHPSPQREQLLSSIKKLGLFDQTKPKVKDEVKPKPKKKEKAVDKVENPAPVVEIPVNTDEDRIMDALSHTPQTKEEILKAAGVEGSYFLFFLNGVREGRMVKKEKGYCLPKEGI